MIDQTRGRPELGLGGPSLRWLHEALLETRVLSRRPSPDVPCITFAGTDEQIVDLERLRDRMKSWPGAQLEWIEGGKHEVLMDTPETRAKIFEQLGAFFENNTQSPERVSRPA